MATDIFRFWARIKPNAFMHPDDAPILNRVGSGFDLKGLPSPFRGKLRTAPIVLLYLAPGALPARMKREARTKAGRDLYVRMRQGHEYLPGPEEDPSSWKWWSSRVKRFGDWQDLQKKIAILNIGAYHAKAFVDLPLLAALPSCRVSLEWAQSVLFPQAMRGERIVICMRAARFWGLEEGHQYGKSLFAPKVTRSGHMRRGIQRDRIIQAINRAV